MSDKDYPFQYKADDIEKPMDLWCLCESINCV